MIPPSQPDTPAAARARLQRLCWLLGMAVLAASIVCLAAMVWVVAAWLGPVA